MKIRELPDPGKKSQRLRAELAAAISRVQASGGGEAEDLINMLQAGIWRLQNLNPVPYPVVNFYFDDNGSPYSPDGSFYPLGGGERWGGPFLHYMSYGETYTPTFLLGIDGGPYEPVGATDVRLRRFEVGQPGGGFGSSNDYFEIDAETGVITSIGDTETPPPGEEDFILLTFRREIVIPTEHGDVNGYAFAYINWIPVNK